MADETAKKDHEESFDDQEETEETESEQGEDEESRTVETADEQIETDASENEQLEKYKQLEAELEETKERLLRVQADYDNFRKRTKSEKEAAAKYRSQSLAEELLPVLDNFERALAVETTHEEATSILTGIDMVYRQFKEALEKEGIQEIEADGKAFDPHKHQAVMQEHSDEHESGMVIAVMQKGYQLKDRVIRPAMVKVSE